MNEAMMHPRVCSFIFYFGREAGTVLAVPPVFRGHEPYIQRGDAAGVQRQRHRVQRAENDRIRSLAGAEEH